MQIVVFRVGLGDYALPVEHVREIVPYRRPRSLPAGAPWELGVISLREQVVPVWQLATRLGLPPAKELGPDTVLVLADGADPVALIVDGVGGIHDLPDGSFEPLALFPEALGIAHLGEELVVVLDPDKLLGRAQGETAAAAAPAPPPPAPPPRAPAPDAPPADILDGLPKRELERRARDAGIPGRSAMDRAQLIAALRTR
jgi:purine-binding chemotaxis protein CheW